MTLTDAEHAAFMRGFNLAQPPGPDEANALERAEEVLPVESGQLRVPVSKDLAKAFLAEVNALPEDLASAAWAGFMRGMIAKAGGAPVHVHHGGVA